MRDLVASFQRAVVTALLRGLKETAQARRPRSLLLTGGVAANPRLRRDAAALADELGLPLFVPPIALSTDNAAMIGAAAQVAFEQGRRAGWDLDADPTSPSDDGPDDAMRHAGDPRRGGPAQDLTCPAALGYLQSRDSAGRWLGPR